MKKTQPKEICPMCGKLGVVKATKIGVNAYWECTKCEKDPEGRRVPAVRTDH